jgi:hypothetical protein
MLLRWHDHMTWMARYDADRVAGWGTWSVSLSGGGRRRLSGLDQFTGLAVGRAGELAFGGQLVVFRKGHRTLIPAAVSPAWRPQGDDLAYVSYAPTNELRDTNGLLRHVPVDQMGLSWSPDGRRIAAVRGTDLLILPVGGGPPERIPIGRPVRSPVAWLDRGRVVALVVAESRRGSVWSQALEFWRLTPRPRHILTTRVLASRPVALPGGGAVAGLCRDASLCSVSWNGRVKTLRRGEVFGSALSLSRDGRFIIATRYLAKPPAWVPWSVDAWVATRTEIVLIPVGGGRERVVPTGVRWPAMAMLLGDGRRLIYSCCTSARIEHLNGS